MQNADLHARERRNAAAHSEPTPPERLTQVHPDTTMARGSVQAVIERYRKTFEQESVLWETARVCVAS